MVMFSASCKRKLWFWLLVVLLFTKPHFAESDKGRTRYDTSTLVLNLSEARCLKRVGLLHQPSLEKQFASSCRSLILDDIARYTD